MLKKVIVKKKYGKHSLASRQLISILFFSSLVTLVSSSFQIFLEYQSDVDQVKEQLQQIKYGHLKGLTNSLWTLDDTQTNVQLADALNLKDIIYLEIREQGTVVSSAGAFSASDSNIKKQFPMIRRHAGVDTDIGSLFVVASLDRTHKRLFSRIIYIVTTQTVKTFLVSFFILFIIHQLVTRHLVSIANQIKALDPAGKQKNLRIKRRNTPHTQNDEFDSLISSFNTMQSQLFREIKKQKQQKQDLQEAEKDLRAAQKRFVTVLDSVDVTVYVVDMNTYEILFMNKAMKKSYGGDLTGEICWQRFHNETGPCLNCSKDHILNPDSTPKDVYIRQMQDPVTKKWFMNYDRAIEWTDGRMVKLQVATDITEFKMMEEELRQTYKLESIGMLAGGIAHDFNNILSIILGNAELAMDDMDELNPAKNNLSEIKIASIRAKEVVHQLLSFCRKTDEVHTIQDLGGLVKESTKLLRASISSSIDIIENIPGIRNHILADATQIHQIIINLCTNAAHAMAENGGILEVHLNNITLEKRKPGKYKGLAPGEYIELIIKDNGTGINPAISNKIFDPYFTTKEVGKGTGMGLAVVHGIVKNHNAAIFVDSTPGKGSVFSVFFPAVQGEEEKQHTPVVNIQPSGSARILFVDDEKAIVTMNTYALSRQGYVVTGRTNPVEAVKTFKKSPESFDLVISDMNMPGMDGIEFALELKKIKPEIPFVICTGDITFIDRDKADQAGISDFVLKPMSLSEMTKMIQHVFKA